MISLQHGYKGGETVEVSQKQLDIVSTQTFIDQLLLLKDRLPRKDISVPTTDGVLKDLSARMIPLFGEGFRLAQMLSERSPMVYVPTNGRYREAMMSPNYDAHGENVRPTVRVIPVNKSGIPIDSALWLPDANQVMALAGGVSMEKKGVGGHGDGTSDVEHKLSVIGAVTLGNVRLASGHAQHHVRENAGSTATALSNGTLGSVFSKGRIDRFDGFDEPIEYDGSTKQVLFIPDSFFDNPYETFGSLIGAEAHANGSITPETYITQLGLEVLSTEQLGQLDTYTKAMEDGVGKVG